MDIRYFLSLIWRRKFLLLFVAALAAAATFLIVSSQPAKYKANAILSTGIVEFKGVSVERENPFIQQFQVENAFHNLIEGMQSRSTLKLLTQRLLEHDFSSDNPQAPFRVLTSGKETPTQEALEGFSGKIPLNQPDSQMNADELAEQNKLFNEVAKALEYDYESLRKHLSVKRIPDTDYLHIEFASENPALSYFAINSFCDEIIRLDRSEQTTEESSAVNFYAGLVKEKKKNLDELTKELSRYESNRNLVNLQEQTKSIVSQLRELELLREQFNKEIPSLRSNIETLNDHIQRTARGKANAYFNAVFLNKDVREIDQRITLLTDQYVGSGQKDETLRKQLDLLKSEKKDLTKRIAEQQTRDNGTDSERNKDLWDKRIEKELDLNTAEASVKSLNKEIKQLKGKAQSLVSDNAYVGNLAQQIEIARKEYFDLVDKLHQAEQVSRKPDSRLRMLEPPLLPEKPEPSNRLILSAFAGASTGILTTIFLVLIAFFDTTPGTPSKLYGFTKLHLIGSIQRLKNKVTDFNSIFFGGGQDTGHDPFKEHLRKLRYVIETSGSNTFLITSLKPGEGKTFFALALAYSLSLNNRKVLLIDANFRHNELSLSSNIQPDDNPFSVSSRLSQTVAVTQYSNTKFADLPTNIHILGNGGGDRSPMEALEGKDFVKWLYDYSQRYDYIIIEGSALNDFADSRELALFAEKVIAVFSAQSSLGQADKEALQFLKSLGNKYLGSVLNKVERID